ncbi:hypothetical protein NWF32_04330 [Pseudomonas qingdaonensis]|nr:hypothetical protein [Pseudomonas qingdaonensis]
MFPLTILADRLIRVADDFERHSGLPDTEQATVAQLRQEAQGLRDAADALRLSMCKAQKPTARNLLYLWERKQLHIEFKAPRKALAAGDFIDEYEVRGRAATNGTCTCTILPWTRPRQRSARATSNWRRNAPKAMPTCSKRRKPPARWA